MYGAFPFIFAKTRKAPITKKKYKYLCYGINIAVMVIFIAINGEPSSGGPYLLWTWIFSSSGLKTLKNRGMLDEREITSCSDHVSTEETTAKDTQIVSHQQDCNICKNCGHKLIDGAAFCNICGAKVSSITPKSNPSSVVHTANNDKICFCRKCGSKLYDDAKFCNKCGTQIITEEN